MRQRIGFARARNVHPELLCRDEPFSALDFLTPQNLRTELLRLWQTGDVPKTAFFIVTHSIKEAVAVADRIPILRKDPGHLLTIFPLRLAELRNRKDSTSQAVTDLVYTILSERDNTVCPDDRHPLRPPAATPTSICAGSRCRSHPRTPLWDGLVPPTAPHQHVHRPPILVGGAAPRTRSASARGGRCQFEVPTTASFTDRRHERLFCSSS